MPSLFHLKTIIAWEFPRHSKCTLLKKNSPIISKQAILPVNIIKPYSGIRSRIDMNFNILWKILVFKSSNIPQKATGCKKDRKYVVVMIYFLSKSLESFLSLRNTACTFTGIHKTSHSFNFIFIMSVCGTHADLLCLSFSGKNVFNNFQ